MLDLMMIICTCFLVTEYVITRRFINVFTVFVIPYMFIIPFNNLIMVRYGFYSITNGVCKYLCRHFHGKFESRHFEEESPVCTE